MKIYSKILFAVLPLLVLGFLAMGLLTYSLSRTAMNELADKWLRTKLSEAIHVVEENQAVLERFDLEHEEPNVAKAQADAAVLLAGIQVGEHGAAMAVDSRGVIVEHPDAGHLGESVAQDPWFKEMAAGDTGRVQYNLNGDPQFGVYQYFEPWGWHVIVGAPQSEVYGEVQKLRAYFWFAGMAVLAVAALALMLLAKRLIKPVHVLVREAEAIGAGDLETPVSRFTNDELDQLAMSIQEMKNRLKTHYDRQEKTIQKRTQDLARKASELESANVRLRELDEMKSSFLSSVSHELRTPLTSVLGFARLIDKDFVACFEELGRGDKNVERKAARIRGNLAIIANEGERLTRLINDFLDLSKIESGKLEWHDAIIDCRVLVDRAVEVTANLFRDNPDVALKVEVAEGLPALTADPDRLTQVLVNLLDNAAKFTEQGEVGLKAEQVKNGLVEIRIWDTGPGIPEDEQEVIFDKFHQLRPKDTISKKPAGTGLGLAICKQIVEHYLGSIRVKSKPGEGAAFIIRLPVEDPAAAVSEDDIRVMRESGKDVILVVDDDPGIRCYLSQVLERAGYGVVTAGSGEAAVQVVDKVKPDLITMDILMPGMDGREAMAAIRNRPEFSGIPILVISVLQEASLACEDARLTKPIDEAKLLSTIESLLNRTESGGALLAVRKNGPFTFDRYFTLCAGGIEQVREMDFWQRMEKGFQGTVILPAAVAGRLDLARLRRMEDVNVLIMPEQTEA